MAEHCKVKEHGTFLDAGELHAIMTFVRGGGLERARQRRIEDLKDEERRLKEQQVKAAQNPDRGWTVESGWGAAELLNLIDRIHGD